MLLGKFMHTCIIYKTYVFVIKCKEGSICDLNINVFVDKYIIRERIFRERHEIKIITVLCAILRVLFSYSYDVDKENKLIGLYRCYYIFL